MSTAFKIEDGIPIPPPSQGRRGADKYGLRQLKVGQSILYPLEVEKNVRAYANKWGVDAGCKFTVRKVEGGVRVWRTE